MATDHPEGGLQGADPGIHELIRELTASNERLTTVVTGLASRVDTTQSMQASLASTMKRVERQQQQSDTQKRITIWLVMVIALILGLALVVVYALYRIDQNADRISEVQDRTSNTVLCPLYGIFLTQITTAGPDAADSDHNGTVTPGEKATYERTVQVIRDGYTALDCHKTKP